MLYTIVLAFPMALVWMIFSTNLSIEGFLVGYVLGFAVIVIVRSQTRRDEDIQRQMNIARIPQQIVFLLIYIVRLGWDVLLSGFDVAIRVLQPTIPIEPDVKRVKTQDPDNNELVSALSAHSITITPGELVIDYEPDGDDTVMLVHVLDKKQSTEESLAKAQTQRLSMIQRILGLDVTQGKKS